MAHKYKYSFYDSADFIGFKKDVRDFLIAKPLNELFALVAVIQKSQRKYAVFCGKNIGKIPQEMSGDLAAFWLGLNYPHYYKQLKRGQNNEKRVRN